MRRLLLVLTIFCLISMPMKAQSHEDCDRGSDEIELVLADEWYADYDAWPDYIASQALDYFNSSGNPENLVSAITASDPDSITANVYYADVTNDNADEILLLTLFEFGGLSFNHNLSIFTCEDGTYEVLSNIRGGSHGSGAWLEIVADTNSNNIPEIVLRLSYVSQKYFETLAFYEWNGQAFEHIYEVQRQYGGYGDLRFTNFDDDPTTTELIVLRIYSYGEATATAYIELSEHRPVNMVHQWTDNMLELLCEYFTDEPTILYQVLQSAEAHRECKQYDEALPIYQYIINDYTNRELEGTSGAFALTQEANETVNSTEFERDYLTAFAYYRVIQISLYQDDMRNAERYLEWMQNQFAEGERGYRYTAMAEEMFTHYQANGDLAMACDAAEIVFNAVRDTDADPPIPYYINSSGHDIWTFPFYFYSGFAYNADPDNLFDVPDDIANMVFIPVCLQSRSE